MTPGRQREIRKEWRFRAKACRHTLERVYKIGPEPHVRKIVRSLIPRRLREGLEESALSFFDLDGTTLGVEPECPSEWCDGPWSFLKELCDTEEFTRAMRAVKLREIG